MKRLIVSLAAIAILALSWAPETLRAKDAKEYFFPEEEILTLQKILDTPKTFLGRPVTFECRFHQLDQIYTPVYTPFTPSDYYNFSCWSVDTKVWRGEEMSTDFPFLYMRKSNDAKPMMRDLLMKLKKYEKLRCTGEVMTVFDGRPYIELKTIVCLEEGETISEKGLFFISQGETATNDGSFTDAAKCYLKAIDAGLCKEYEGMCYLRAGELNYKARNYERALELLKLAQKRLPEEDKSIKDLIDIVEHIITNEETGRIPADVAAQNAAAVNADMSKELEETRAEVERLRNEINELSNQKIEFLKEKGDLETRVSQLEQQLMSQEELQKLRDEIKAMKEQPK